MLLLRITGFMLVSSIMVSRCPGRGPALFNNNFVQGIASPGGGGVIISRGETVNNTVTNNSACAIANYAADGVNPGYVPATLPGTNTIIPSASVYGDYTYLDPWIALNPTTRSRT
jgi:hypothetical protein